MARRRRQAEESPSHERWLVSYADFMTLLFAFFTSLYAISIVDAEKGSRLVHSIRESFGQLGLDPSGSGAPIHWEGLPSGPESDREAARAAEDTRFDRLEKRTQQAIGDGVMGTQGLSVRRSEEGLVISLAGSHFFEEGTSRPSAAARAGLTVVAALLRDLPNHLRVEGHTDDRPISTRAIASNWHLSVLRAVEVVGELERAGVARHRVSASGFADQRPLVSNGSAQGRRMNRRVDIVVLRTKLFATDS